MLYLEDENHSMERGWDPEIKSFFKKLINSISLGLLWLLTGLTAGLYHGLAFKGGIAGILFYVVMLVLLGLYIRTMIRTWKPEKIPNDP